MIYRFLSKLATQDRLEAFPKPVADTSVKFFKPPYEKYEAKFEKVAMDSEPVGVGVYEAPVYSQYDGVQRGMCLRFNAINVGKELPDVWSVQSRLIVSDKFRKIVDDSDSTSHEYIPIQWLDGLDKVIETKENYYWLNQRRFLRVEPGNRVASPHELGFFSIDHEEDFLSRVLDEPDLENWLYQFPMWQHWGAEGVIRRQTPVLGVVYFSEEFYKKLKKSFITGLDVYTKRYGEGEESVCPIRVTDKWISGLEGG